MDIALCQFNPTVGAVIDNARAMLSWMTRLEQTVDCVVFPELSLCGYPPQDLLFLDSFLESCQTALQNLSDHTPMPLIVGAPTQDRYNAAFWCFQGTVRLLACKRLLPNYQVFDEQRYFCVPSQMPPLKKPYGVSICEDAWSEALGYSQNPIQDLVEQGAEILINLQASPFELGKSEIREKMFCNLAKKYQKPFLIAGQVGANDGLIFDGGSLAIDAQGTILWRAESFKEEIYVVQDLSCCSML